MGQPGKRAAPNAAQATRRRAKSDAEMEKATDPLPTSLSLTFAVLDHLLDLGLYRFEVEQSWSTMIMLVVSVLTMVYLIYALLRPEKF